MDSAILPPLDLALRSSYELVKPLETPPILQAQPSTAFTLRLGELPDGRAFLHSSALPWTLPSTPLLWTRGKSCREDVPLIEVPDDSMDLQLTIKNELSHTQAIHLHGIRFQVVALIPPGSTKPLSVSDPLSRDTVPILGGGSVVLRLSLQSPGMWMLEATSANLRKRGAATALSVRPASIPPIPAEVPVQGPCSALVV